MSRIVPRFVIAVRIGRYTRAAIDRDSGIR